LSCQANVRDNQTGMFQVFDVLRRHVRSNQGNEGDFRSSLPVDALSKGRVMEGGRGLLLLFFFFGVWMGWTSLKQRAPTVDKYRRSTTQSQHMHTWVPLQKEARGSLGEQLCRCAHLGKQKERRE
jgi:hypothetical protein